MVNCLVLVCVNVCMLVTMILDGERLKFLHDPLLQRDHYYCAAVHILLIAVLWLIHGSNVVLSAKSVSTQ